MVIAAVSFVLAITIPAAAASASQPAGTEAVRSALSRGGYPWYDAKSGRARPVWPPGTGFAEWLDRWFGWVDRFHMPGGVPLSLGRLSGIILAVLAATVLFWMLVQRWRIYRAGPADDASAGNADVAVRIEGLPAGLRPETVDPWNEALECRARGDYARAIVCLFAHQLLTLDRLKMIRLSPGRTARQLIGSVPAGDIRGWVEPTLRLFESVYYGHRIPTPASFEAVWSLAEAFESRISAEARA